MATIITPSGIIKNPEKPRSGVVSIHSLREGFSDEILKDGIDITYEELVRDLKKTGKSEKEIEEELSDYESYASDFLIGDAWIKDSNGFYSIDKTKTFAAIYNNESGTLVIEWSKYTKLCGHTSPCFVMRDGSGPCGDLDSGGATVIAYSLPSRYWRKS